jgi:hypothetical protein
MTWLARFAIELYSWMLQFFPGRFKDKFAEEMHVVFRDSIAAASMNGLSPLILVCIKELTGLPLNILTEYFHEVMERKVEMKATNEKIHWQGKVKPVIWPPLLEFFLSYCLGSQACSRPPSPIVL